MVLEIYFVRCNNAVRQNHCSATTLACLRTLGRDPTYLKSVIWDAVREARVKQIEAYWKYDEICFAKRDKAMRPNH